MKSKFSLSAAIAAITVCGGILGSYAFLTSLPLREVGPLILPVHRAIARVAGATTITLANSATVGTASNVTSLTLSNFDPGSGSNAYLLVGVSYYGNNGAMWSATFNGGSMGSPIMYHQHHGNDEGIMFFGMLAPVSGAHNIVVSSTLTQKMRIIATSWNEVNQSAPTGTFATSDVSTEASIATSVAGVSGDVIVDLVHALNVGTTIATTAGQTTIQNSNSSAPGAMSYSVAAGSSTNASYSFSPNSYGELAGVALKPVSGGGSPPPPPPAPTPTPPPPTPPPPSPTPTPTPPPVGGATYYVAKTGSDSNPCSLSQPCLTIGKGITKLASGNTLEIGAGTYVEAINDTIPAGSSWSSATTVKAASGATVVLQPSTGQNAFRALYFANPDSFYIVVDGLIIDAANVQGEAVKVTTAANHIRLKNMEIKNAPTMGVLMTDTGTEFNEILNSNIHDNGNDVSSSGLYHQVYLAVANALVDGNTLDCGPRDPLGHGIHLYGSAGMDNNIFRNNVIRNCGRALGFYGGVGNLIYNNVIYHSNIGIYAQPYEVIGGAKVYNNTIYDIFTTPGGGGPGILIQNTNQGSSNVLVKNNIVYNTAGAPVSNNSVAGQTSNNLTTNPSFVNAGSADFHLQSVSSAINAGAALAEVPMDKDGVSRPQGAAYDIGAYEYVSGSPTPPSPTPIPTPPPPTPTPPANQKPTGFVDGVNTSSNQVFGWANDPDNTSVPVTIHMYFDINAGSAGASPIACQAGDFRSDVGNHAFNCPIPSNLINGQSHQVWVWGIDLTDPANNNQVLSGSPKSFSIASPTPPPAPVPPPAPTPTPTPNPPPASSGGSGGSGGVGGVAPSPSPTSTPPTSSGGNASATSTAFSNIKLVKEGNTFFVITNGTRLGVTNPGVLFSYGLEFGDAVNETAQENLLPYTDNLKPGDGSLVKKAEDPTVWLISEGTKHGFTSASVFLGLGYRFDKVLLVTSPELDVLPQGDLISDISKPHKTGTYINDGGTIYRVTYGQRQGIPSPEVWNSLHLDNDYSDVVLANQADRAISLGTLIAKRVVQ